MSSSTLPTAALTLLLALLLPRLLLPNPSLLPALLLAAPCYLLSASLTRIAHLALLKWRQPGLLSFDDLRGPDAPSWMWGSEKELYLAAPGVLYSAWGKRYGGAYRFRGVFGARNIVLTDPTALHHILSTAVYTYPKPRGGRAWLGMLLGEGVLVAEGTQHARQRRLLHRAFTAQAMRGLCGVFFDCANKTVEQWNALLEGRASTAIDVQYWANRISLDAIGLAGFSHSFDSLSPTAARSPLAAAFDTLTDSSGSSSAFVLRALLFVFPAILRMPSNRTKSMLAARESLGEVVRRVWREARAGSRDGGGVGGEEGSGSGSGRTVLDLLVRESEEGEGLTEEEVEAQMMTLVFAGYETTSCAISWALHELAHHPLLQSSLRATLLSSPPLNPSNLTTSPPLLDAIVKETLRVHPPILDLHREAEKEDVVPLQGGKALVVEKGTVVTVPLNVLLEEGEGEWRPERWLEEDANGRERKGQSHQMWAFSDGPRVCIGRTFALLEIKAVLATLVREYVFEPEGAIEPFVSFVVRPRVKGGRGSTLPLRVRRAE